MATAVLPSSTRIPLRDPSRDVSRLRKTLMWLSSTSGSKLPHPTLNEMTVDADWDTPTSRLLHSTALSRLAHSNSLTKRQDGARSRRPPTSLKRRTLWRALRVPELTISSTFARRGTPPGAGQPPGHRSGRSLPSSWPATTSRANMFSVMFDPPPRAVCTLM